MVMVVVDDNSGGQHVCVCVCTYSFSLDFHVLCGFLGQQHNVLIMIITNTKF